MVDGGIIDDGYCLGGQWLGGINNNRECSKALNSLISNEGEQGDVVG